MVWLSETREPVAAVRRQLSRSAILPAAHAGRLRIVPIMADAHHHEKPTDDF